MTAVMTSVLQVVTCNVFDAFDLLHVLILLCLKAAIIILLKLVVGKRGIYEGEKGIS